MMRTNSNDRYEEMVRLVKQRPMYILIIISLAKLSYNIEHIISK